MEQQTIIYAQGAIMHNDRILLLKRSRTAKLFPGLWETPGGKPKETDATLVDACVREVQEETGLIFGTNLVLADVFDYVEKGCRFVVVHYLAVEFMCRDIVLSPEHTGYAWYGADGLAVIPMSDHMGRAVQRILLRR